MLKDKQIKENGGASQHEDLETLRKRLAEPEIQGAVPGEMERCQAFLFTLSERLRNLTAPYEIINEATRTLGEQLGVAQVGFGEIDEAQEHIIVHSDWNDGRIPSVVGTWRIKDFGLVHVEEMKRGRTIAIPDITKDPLTNAPAVIATYKGIAIRAMVNMPLVKSGRMVAVLFIRHPEPRLWSAAEVVLIEETCERLWAPVERARAEEVLRESEARFRAALRAGNFGLWDWYLDTNLVFSDITHKQLFGFHSSRAAVHADEIFAAIHPNDRDRVRIGFDRALQEGGVFEAEFRIMRRNFDVRWLSGYGDVVRNSEGEPLRIVGVNQDITERRRTDEALRQSNEELERFAFMASHDLQEPLRMVTAYSQLLVRRYRGQLDEQADEFLGFILDGTRRMGRLIQDLLVYARSTSGEPLHLRPTDANVALALALANLGERIEETQPTLTWDQLPDVMAAEGLLAQVFQNLIGNALKYKRPDVTPEIHISVEKKGAEWVFSVRDNGQGIAPAHQNRIFTLFTRLHDREVSGTGIGLATVKRIIERHSGCVWLQSEPGVGSTFFFTLPVSSTEPETK